MLNQLASWSSTLGHTAGLVTPNTVWYKTVSNGQVVEIWKNVETSGYTAVLLVPGIGFKPGQLDPSCQLLGDLVFTRWSQLISTGWLALV